MLGFAAKGVFRFTAKGVRRFEANGVNVGETRSSSGEKASWAKLTACLGRGDTRLIDGGLDSVEAFNSVEAL